MRLPDKKRQGDPVLASDWNLLLDAITERTPRPGTGLLLVANSGGFAYSSPPAPSARPPGQSPFSVIAIEKAGASYNVTVKEGWVIERKPKTGDHPAVKFWMPKYGGTELNATPRPPISMGDGDIAKCRVKTDAKGEISETPTIVVEASGDETDGTHYAPQDPAGSGTDGDVLVPLFKLWKDADGVPNITVYQQSDIENWAQLWTGENVGTGYGVFKEHAEADNLYKFRTIGGPGASLSEDGLTILINGGPTGAHLNLFIETRLYNTDENGFLYLTGSAYGYLYRWRHGHYVGQFAVDAAPLDGDNLLTIVTERATHLLQA